MRQVAERKAKQKKKRQKRQKCGCKPFAEDGEPYTQTVAFEVAIAFFSSSILSLFLPRWGGVQLHISCSSANKTVQRNPFYTICSSKTIRNVHHDCVWGICEAVAKCILPKVFMFIENERCVHICTFICTKAMARSSFTTNLCSSFNLN